MEDINRFRKRMRLIARICFAVMFLSFATIMILQFIAGLSNASDPVTICCVVGMLGVITVVVVSILIGGKSDLMARQLIENQQKYQAIIAASNTGAWEHHADTGLDWHSAEYFKMLGYEEDEFKNKHLNIADVWINLLHPDDRDEAIKKFNQYLKSNSTELYENYFRLKHKNGNWIWIWSRGQTLRKPDGTKTAVTLGTHIDVTDRKNLEIALLKLNETLFKYAYLNAHKVRGPLARLLGLIEVSKLDTDLDYKWCLNQIGVEAYEVDKVLKQITSELNDIEIEEKQRFAAG